MVTVGVTDTRLLSAAWKTETSHSHTVVGKMEGAVKGVELPGIENMEVLFPYGYTHFPCFGKGLYGYKRQKNNNFFFLTLKLDKKIKIKQVI